MSPERQAAWEKLEGLLGEAMEEGRLTWISGQADDLAAALSRLEDAAHEAWRHAMAIREAVLDMKQASLDAGKGGGGNA